MTLAGKRVLLTGDSHMDWSPFGSRLEAKLRERGATVTNLSVGGSSARSWSTGRACRPGDPSRCRTVAELASAGPFDLVIVSLGTNDAANAHAEGADLTAAARQTAARMRALVTHPLAPRVLIVGPPRMGRTTGHYTDATMAPVSEALRRAFGSRFIDSRQVPHIDGDGIHAGPRGGEAWAQYVVERVQSGSSGISTFGAVLIASGLVWWLRRRGQQ